MRILVITATALNRSGESASASSCWDPEQDTGTAITEVIDMAKSTAEELFNDDYYEHAGTIINRTWVDIADTPSEILPENEVILSSAIQAKAAE
ncbi:MAG: hypothetical protein P8Y47_08050 [Alphaproteobacteria bacterium]